MNNKILLTGLVLASLASTTMAAGVNNTVDPNAAGYGAESYGKSNTITATGTSSFAVGFENTVSGANSLVYGHNNKATGANSFAGGENSEAKGYSSLAIGSSAQALSDYTFAIGSQARANGNNTVAVGNGSYASNTNALAVGYDTKASGKDSLAVGSFVKSNSDNNVAIGNNITTNDKDSIGIGSSVTTNSNNSVGIGSMVTTNKDRSIAIGNGVATDFNTVGIGNGVETKVKDTIAIGNGVISKGESSVAIGNAIHADGVGTVNVGTNVSAKGVSSIVIGRDTTVNGDDTTVVGANNGTVDAAQSAVYGYNNKVLNNSKEQLIFGSNSQTGAQGAVAFGTHASATAIDALAFGNNTVADVQNGVAIGTNSVTESPVGTTNIKNNTTDIRFSNSTYAGSNPDSVVSFGTNGRAGAGGVTEYTRQLQNLAAGRVSATSTDGINGSQLYDVALEAQKHNTLVDGTNTTVTSQNNAFGRKEYKVNVNRDLTNMNSVQFNTVNDPQRNFVSKDGMHVFNGEVNTNYGSNGIKLENTNNLDTAEYNMDGININSNGKNIRFGTDGISAGNQIINNVKAGVADTDAVNVSQLKKVKDEITAATGTTTVTAGDHITVTPTINGNSRDYKVSLSKDITDQINNNTTNIDKNKTEINKNRDDINKNRNDINKNKDDIKNNRNDINKNRDDINKNRSDINKNAGNIANNTTNIAKNTEDIKNIKGNVTDIQNNITNINNNMNSFKGDLSKMDKRIDKSVAGAAALAALHPLDFDPDAKWDFAAGYGHYRSGDAAAIGAFYRPNEDVQLSIGSTVGGDETVFNAGLSVKVGAHNGVSRSRVAIGKEVLALKKTVAEQNAQIQKLTALLNGVAGTKMKADHTTLFPDVAANHWAYEAVSDLSRRGLVEGYPDGTFGGDRLLTRYEFAQIVYRAIQDGVTVDDRLVTEFSPEMALFRVDTVAKNAQGEPTIERVRVNKK